MAIVNNSQQAKLPTISFEDWKTKYPNLVAGLSEVQAQEAYQKWLAKQNSPKTGGSTIQPQFTDNSNETSTTNKTDNSRSNVDLLGLTDTFTHLGIATGNTNIIKLGTLANTGVSTFQRVRNLKGLKGVDKTVGVAGIAGDAADTLDNVFFGDQATKNSSLTNGLNAGYDMASTALMSMGGPASIVGGFMKVGGLASDMLTAAGIGTDQMTTTDQFLDSKFMKLTPIGLVNGIFSSTSDRFAVDNNVRSQIGGSYGGAYAFMDDAASKAGKEYGLFSSGARDDANEQIGKAKVMQGQIGRINKNAQDKRAIVANTNELLSANYMFNLAGGYDQRYMRAAKEGSKIERIKKINLTFKKGGQIHNVINLETKEIEWRPVLVEDNVQEFKNGGNIEHQEWEPNIETAISDEEVQTLQEGGELFVEKKVEPENFTLKDYIEQKILERTQEAIKKATTRKKPYMFKNKNWKNCIATATDNYGVPICLRNSDFAANPQKWGFEELQFGDTVDTLPEGVLIQDYNKPKQPNTPGHTVMLVSNKEGEKPLYSYSSGDNTPESMHNQVGYGFYRWDDKIKPRAYRYIGTPSERKAWEEEYNKLYKPFMKDGGKTEESIEESLSNQQNVIPEGALHARKHHMENTEGLTQKGIPVIDNKGEQQAEIELNEIIFNLEVTKKLEELCEDGSDEAAIEAGKLLVQEILFNTEDRTGLINTLKKGGKIEWQPQLI